ncbi:MAG: hypothetical protein EBU90_13475 [Proteobacteria bacterium]|nr:hypothetical protein [Pseudomonadota bacterium]
MINYLMLLAAIALSGSAAYYSIVGLIAIFSSAVIPITIMGSTLEITKLVLASWLYRNWSAVPKFLKAYYVFALAVLMVLTSLGIFGFLSKAHSDQSLVSGDVLSKVAVYDEKIKTLKENIDANRKILKQLDEQVDQVMGRSDSEKGAERSIVIRKSQQQERTRLQAEIQTSQKEISNLTESSAPIRAQVRQVEAEVGPIKYIASLLYGDSIDQNLLESAVRFVIIMIVVVFDPLAVLMLIGANWGLANQHKKIEVETKIEEVNNSKEEVNNTEDDSEVWDDFFNEEDLVEEVEIESQDLLSKTIVEEVEEIQQKKTIEYDSLGRQITPNKK